MYQLKANGRIAVRNSLLVAVLATLALGFVAGCSKPTPAATPAPAKVVLTASGSATTSNLLGSIKAAFEAGVPDYSLNVLPGTGTGGGVEGAIQGVLDVAAMGRRPNDDEASQIEFVSLGWGAEIPIAHADVGVTNLTKQELVAIFSGEITNWSQVGGPDLGIIVYVRGSDTVHTKVIREHVFGDAPFAETAQMMGGLGDMTAAVEGTPGGVGYGNCPGVIGSGVDVQAIAVDGLEHDNPAYLALLELGIGYLPERQADVQPLIDWLFSEPGQTALREAGMMIK